MLKMLTEDNYHDFHLWKEGKLARVECLDTPFNIYRRRQSNRLSRHLEYKDTKEDQSPRLRKLVYDRLSKACRCTHCQSRDERRTPPP